jgi:GNAT superfamily N-acetyltransferase
MNIRHTGTKYLKEYGNHLKELPINDRYTRFGFTVGECAIDKLILSMVYHPEQHHLFTAMVDNKIVGFTHLALEADGSRELAVSVNSDQQGKGIADQLMAYTIRWAKTKHIKSMFMHCINENKKIQHLARKHNLKVVYRDGCDITAQVMLPQITILEYLRNLFMTLFHR